MTSQRDQPRLEVALEDLPVAVGAAFGPSQWLEVTQESIRAFAEVTGDVQWIHVDEQCAANGPFGGTIAHGYLTLSLVPALLPQIFAVTGTTAAINYGADRIRFPRPLRSGSRIRLRGCVADVRPVDGGQQTWLKLDVETDDGSAKPVCAAIVVLRYLA